METEKLKIALNISEKPFGSVEIKNSEVEVCAHNKENKLVLIKFKDFQSVKLTSNECTKIKIENYSNILEVLNSNWINKLTEKFKNQDEIINFENNARHFIIPLETQILEVISWAIECKTLD